MRIKPSSESLFIFSLAVAAFATFPMRTWVALFLVDIHSDFQIPLGIIGQLRTIAGVAAITFGLLMGILSVRFKHRTLLVFGSFCIVISAIGCFVSTNFTLMSIFYFLSGVGSVVVGAMALALIGEFITSEKRAKPVSWITSMGSLAYIVSAPIMGLIAVVGNWRSALLWLIIPLSLGALFISITCLRFTPQRQLHTVTKGSFSHSFRRVLLNKSAVACLVGNACRQGAFIVLVFYSVSFYRQYYSISSEVASLILMVGALAYTLGSLVAGRIVGKLGKKPLVVVPSFLAVISILFFVWVPGLLFSLIINYLGSWMTGMAFVAANCLTLEQVPDSQGTMMSLSSSFTALGDVLGAAIGGGILVVFSFSLFGKVSYGIMGLILGFIGLAGAISILIWAKSVDSR